MFSKVRQLITALAVTTMLVAAALAQTADPKAKAEEVLKQARAAIADEGKFKGLQSLSFSGTTRRTFGEMQMESETEYEIMLPDKFRRTDNSQFATVTQALNGDQTWTDFVPGMGMGGGPGGGGGRMMGMGGGGGFGGGGNPNDPQAQERQRNNQRAEFARLFVGMLITSPSSFPLEYSYLGEAKSPDGTADAILAKGAGDFKIALYFDQQTHKLLMMSWKGKQFSQMQRRGGPGGPGGQGAQGARQPGQTGQGAGQAAGQGERPQLSPEEIEKRRKEREEMIAKLPDVEFRWVFADYKNVSGFNLPHRVTKLEAGKPNEEFEISKFKVNPKLNPDKFVKKEKEKSD